MPDLEALSRLRSLVEAAPEPKFNMTQFRTGSDCGTAYCALGHAAIDPWFVEHHNAPGPRPSLDHTEARDQWALNFDQWCDTEKACKVFGLSSKDSFRLFGGDLFPYQKVSKSEVLANIDRLLAGLPAKRYAALKGFPEVLPG